MVVACVNTSSIYHMHDSFSANPVCIQTELHQVANEDGSNVCFKRLR